MRRLLEMLCVFLEKTLYDEPTYDELSKELDKTKHFLDQALEMIEIFRERERKRNNLSGL